MMMMAPPPNYDNNDGVKHINKNNTTITKQQRLKIRNVRDMDVLCGRGKLQCSHRKYTYYCICS